MNICVFGSSIAWGEGDTEQGGWAERLKLHYMNERDGVYLYNCGVSADTSTDLLRRFVPELEAREPTVVVIAIGINDSLYVNDRDHHWVDLATYQQNLAALLDRARSHNVKRIVFVGLTRVDESKTMPIPWETDQYYDNESIEQYDEALKEFCESNTVQYIPVANLVDPTTFEDGLHPGPEGHQQIFEIVRDHLKL